MDRTRHNRQVYDEAAEWFVNFRCGDIDGAAKKSFNQWLRQSPHHIEAYLEVSAFWADVPQVVSKEEIDVAALIAQARAEANVVELGPFDERENQTAGMAPAKKPFTRRPFAMAASVLIAGVGVAALVWWQLSAPTYTTGIGEQRLIALPDGSSVELNTRSRIRVHITAEKREVELLDGQALFRVEQDPNRPFIVQSGATLVRAVGTRFDVYRKTSGTVVTVLEGRVAILPHTVDATPLRAPSIDSPKQRVSTEADGAPVFLSAGEQITVTATRVLKAEPANVAVATAWTQRQLVFQGTPLPEVVAEVNRYNSRQIVIADPTLQTVRISGVFSLTRPTSLVLFLRDEVGLQVNEEGDRILISRE